LGEDGAFKRNRRGDVRQQARGLADEGLIGSMRERALRGVERWLGCVQVAARDRHERLREAEPWAGGCELARQGRKPPGQSRPFAAQDEPVDVLLDHQRGLGGIPAASAWRTASSAS
jgi:hypothetical protein